MCFSPAASFVSAAALAVIGHATLKKAENDNERLLAGLPWMFAAQQAIEGLLWMSLPYAQFSQFSFVLTLLYTTFAVIIWPIFVPLGLYMVEPQPMRRRFLLGMTLAGTGLAIFALYVMMAFGVVAEIGRACIVYGNTSGFDYKIFTIAYVVITCVPFLWSSYWGLNAIGVLNFAAFMITYFFYRIDFVSVWCFFAALISGCLYLFFRRVHPQIIPEEITYEP